MLTLDATRRRTLAVLSGVLTVPALLGVGWWSQSFLFGLAAALVTVGAITLFNNVTSAPHAPIHAPDRQ